MDQSLLVKYLRNEADSDEVAQVEQWVSAHPDNRKLLEELYCTLFVADRMAVMDAVDTEASLKAFKERLRSRQVQVPVTTTPKVRPMWRYAGAVAAFVAGVILTVGIGLGLSFDKMSDYTLVTASGQRAQTILPDGSKVWLNGSTRLVYHNEWWSSDRRITLEGEAYFEVEKSGTSTFSVTSKGITTKVLGTKFNMRAREGEDNVSTTLFQGKVSMLSPTAPEDGYLLKPGQTLRINTSDYSTELMECSTPSEVLLWLNGKLDFKQYSLSRITHIMETLHDVTFVYEDESLQNEQFTGQFSTDDQPESILNVLRYTGKFAYRKEGKVIYLYKE